MSYFIHISRRRHRQAVGPVLPVTEFDGGIEAVVSSPDALRTSTKQETAKWGKLIKDAGIRAY